jgi:hypothetical protein
MDQTYRCNQCDIDFPDKQIATGHRNGTGHILKQGGRGVTAKHLKSNLPFFNTSRRKPRYTDVGEKTRKMKYVLVYCSNLRI